jgi:hypothetical protein
LLVALAARGEIALRLDSPVDRLARLRTLDGERLALVSDMLEAALHHVAVPFPATARGPAGRPTWREWAGLEDG